MSNTQPTRRADLGTQAEIDAAEAFAVSMTVFEYVSDGLDIQTAIAMMSAESSLSTAKITQIVNDTLINEYGIPADQHGSALTRLIIETATHDLDVLFETAGPD